jgi:3-methyladenine DNA glycosylase AlkD
MDLDDDLQIAAIADQIVAPQTDDPQARLTTPVLRARRREISRALRVAPASDVLRLARLAEGQLPQEQKWVAYELVRFHPGAFAAIGVPEIEDFADRTASWYAVDGLGTILTGALWARGQLPDVLFDAWSRSENRWLRRSALVATVGRNAVRPDPERTFALCLRLADDRDDMVEKAVSWALRWLSQKDRAVVEAFWAAQADRFRPRVRREVSHKLSTGRKTPRRR